MSTPKSRWAAATAAIVTLAALPALAQPGRLPIGRSLSHGGPIHSAIAKLNLTPEQDAKVKAVAEAENNKLGDLRARVRPAKDALAAAARSANPDPATVGRLYLAVLAAEAAVKSENAKFHDAITALLTPEQRAQFESYLASATAGEERWQARRATHEE